MGWPPYEVRDATAKLCYAGRFMPTTNDFKRIHMHLQYRNLKTGWIKRFSSLETKYKKNFTKHEAQSAHKWQQIINKKLASASKLAWHTAVSKKKGLSE